MYSWPVMTFVTVIFTAVHMSIWQLLPKKMRHIVFAMPVLAFVLDFMGSGLIMVFTGDSGFIGMCNMAASVFFGIYVVISVNYYGIKGIKLNWYKLWILPVWPKLDVEYCKNGVSRVE